MTVLIKKNARVLQRCVAGLSLLAVSASAAPADHKATISKHDFIWDSIPTTRETGSFIGNGMLGASIWASKGETLRWELGRNDVYLTGPGLSSRTLIGKLLLKPKGTPKSSTMHQSLYTAEVSSRIETDQGVIHSRSIIPYDKMVGLVEFRVEGKEKVSVDFSQLPCILPGVLRDAIKTLGPKFGLKKHPVRDFSAPVYDPIVEELKKDRKASPHPESTRGKTKGVEWVVQPYKDGGGFVVAWGLKETGKRSSLMAYTLLPYREGAPNSDEAVQMIHNAWSEAFDAQVKRHQSWWKQYYAKSYVSLPDEVIEGYYWRQIYKIGAATRSDGVVLDELGPWPGASAWVRVWNNLNIQIAYLCPLTANHLELCEPFINLFNSNHQILRDAVPTEWKANGAMGLGRMQDVYGYTSFRKEFGNLPWALHDYWLYCRYSGNEELMKNQLFTLLKGSANLSINALTMKDDGFYHFPKDISPEYPGKNGNAMVEDSHYAISTLMWNLKILQHLNEKFNLSDPQAARWSEVQAKLSPLPIDETGLMVGSDTPFIQGHRHYSHLLAFFPLCVIDPESPEGAALFEKSVDNWASYWPTGRNFFSVSGEAAMRAWLRDGDAAAEILDYGIPNKLTPNTHFAGAGVAIESALSGMWSVGEMLLQSWSFDPSEYCIRILPAIPESWKDVRFDNLRAEGAFLVSAQKKEGQLKSVRIVSEAGHPCRVEVPFSGTFKLFVDGKKKPAQTSRNNHGDQVFNLQLEKGQTAILVSE
ncbi:hypothetical protein SCARR_00077 [Pontiella sulfatireligans]|uniref:Glycosyl hydrolase family 95 N-terminal domain-containing protein n=2 Tax=Pontiella sulfatireligans TaxID=2750658 RepID=A0A6C2UER6_9BACT|nr:hypothetical protein SCARR_00077 [Pontiella sulfatireligans]